MKGTQDSLASERRHPPIDADHAAHTFRSRDAAQLCLLGLTGSGARTVDGLPPIFENPAGVGDSEAFDDVDQSALGFGELLGQADRLVEKNSRLIGDEPGLCPGPEGGPGVANHLRPGHEPMGSP
ncbi:MAG TPA: hypothetical protein VHM29_07525 [Acidimicrobiia bacterium]|nr:hypothetical protein [Acidimicrobiia bacterium]